MAYALTARYHGEEARSRPLEERFDTVHVRHELPDEIEEFAFSADNGQVHLPALLAEAFGLSRSEARRLLAQGGVKLDGTDARRVALDLPAERARRRRAPGRQAALQEAPKALDSPVRSWLAAQLGSATLLRRATGAGWKPHP